MHYFLALAAYTRARIRYLIRGQGSRTPFSQRVIEKGWQKVDLVTLDALGYLGLGPGGPLLFQFCAERYERGSILITSNLDFSRWSEVFTDSTLTAALLDRLTHHAHILIFQGESHRFRESRKRLGEVQILQEDGD